MEPRFNTSEGLRMPDILVWNDTSSALIETTIVGEMFWAAGDIVTLDTQYDRKLTYYDQDDIKNNVKERTGFVPEIFPLVISVRGIWYRKNDEALAFLGLKSTKTILELKALEGSIAVWRSFRKSS